jgi:hypothetical protein
MNLADLAMLFNNDGNFVCATAVNQKDRKLASL